jgi:acetyltransferase-like isoleucine patch superfamily enzyme
MVEVGDYCFIGSDTRVTPGARIPDRCVIAMGAVVAGRLEEEDTLYGGVPARPIKKVEGAKYFDRDWGHLGGP